MALAILLVVGFVGYIFITALGQTCQVIRGTHESDPARLGKVRSRLEK